MTFLRYLFIFCLFSFLGWILECLYRSYNNKKFINPGFMSGCVVPLYGFGAVILNIICHIFENIKYDNKIIAIFILSLILLTTLEFICGVISEKFFRLKLWDYSNEKYNYKGYICLKFSLLWGFASIIFYYFVFPWINDFSIKFVNNTICLLGLGLFLAVFILDLFVSVKLIGRTRKYAKEIRKVINVEKLKLDLRPNGKKLFNVIYPHSYINEYLKNKLKI